MNEIQQIEQYLQNKMNPEDKLLMDARLIIDHEFRDTLFWQQKTYFLINRFGRKKLKAEIESVQERMFTETGFTSFRNKIKNIFK